jgi:GNAT superfamily N-acetyltransferase
MDEVCINTPAGKVRVREGTSAEVIDLRRAILRQGLPRESAIFPEDQHSGTRHVVAVDATSGVVGCATAQPSTWDGQPAWQLRGMAVDSRFRGSGIGRAMLDQLERTLRADAPVTRWWCNARLPAVGFYERMGWKVASQPFEIPTAGPHVKMIRSLL